MTIKQGDRVADMDEGLAMLRQIMGTGEPNHHGTVSEVIGDTAYILYDDDQCAPCPVSQLVKLDE